MSAEEDLLNFNAAVIRSHKEALRLALKKAESDAALIESLNRYIEALEGKAAMWAKTIKELRERMDTLLAVCNHK